MKIYLCFLLIVLWKIEANASPSITNPPVSVNAYLDTWVSFHCEGEGDVLVWITNGISLSDEIKETRNITILPGITTPGIVISTLVIFAKPENHDLNIGCVVGIHGSFMFDSAGANLFVKGIRPVENLIFNISMNESARVSWNRPSFVSDDVIVLFYRVTIKSDTDNIVIEHETIEHEYEVSIDMLNVCSIYTVNVIAFDENYAVNSSIKQEYTIEYSAVIDGVYITVEETGNFTIRFKIMLEGILCPSTITGFTQLNVPDGVDNHEMKHDTERIEPKNSIFYYMYTVHNVAPQEDCIFDCQIKDELDNIKAIDDWNFTTHHVQDFTAYVHENGSIYVQCIFANNSNASGCGLNFTEREDIAVTLYSVQINKLQGSEEASGYINLPVSGNLTVIAFDILNDEVSDKASVIYNGLAEIELLPTKPIPTNTVNSVLNNTYFSSSSYVNSDSNSDRVQSTAILSVEMSSAPTIEMESTKASNELKILVISGGVPFISCVMIIIITGIVMISKHQRTKQKQRQEVFEVVSSMAQENTYARSDDIVRVVRFRVLDRSSETMEESDHEHVDAFLDGHIPNPPSMPSQPSPPLQPPPSYFSLSIPLTHPAVTQTMSDTSSPNRRPSYRSQTSRSSEDDNLLRPDDIPYDDGDKTEDNESNNDEINDVEYSGTTLTNQPSQQFQEPTPEICDMPTSGYYYTSTMEMEEIPSVTQKSTNVVSTPAVSKDVVPSHYADIELSHKGGTYDPIQNKRNQVVYSTVISVEGVPWYDLVKKVEESPETMSIHSNNTHLSTGNEKFKQVEELNNPRDLTIATHSVLEDPTLQVGVNSTKKIRSPPGTSPVFFNYDENPEASLTSISSNTPLLHSPPICKMSPKKLPPRDKKRLTNGIETEESNNVVKPKDSPPSYNEDVMIDKEPTTEFSTDYQTKGFLVIPAPKTRLPVGSHIIGGSIQFLDGTEDYHTDPHLAYNQEKENNDIILPSPKDACDTENKSDGNRHGALPLSPPPEQENKFRLYPAGTEETPHLVVTSINHGDLLEEENLSDDRQQVDCSDGQLVTPEFYRKDWMSFLVTYKFPESEIHVKNKEESEIEEEIKKRGHNTENDGPTAKLQTTRDSLTTSVLIKAKLVRMSVGMQVELAMSGILEAFKIKLEITQKAIEHKKHGNLTRESINEAEVQWAALSITNVVSKIFYQMCHVGFSYNPVKCGLLAYCLSSISSVFVSYFPT